jgi:hypothetical protein
MIVFIQPMDEGTGADRVHTASGQSTPLHSGMILKDLADQ